MELKQVQVRMSIETQMEREVLLAIEAKVKMEVVMSNAELVRMEVVVGTVAQMLVLEIHDLGMMILIEILNEWRSGS